MEIVVVVFLFRFRSFQANKEHFKILLALVVIVIRQKKKGQIDVIGMEVCASFNPFLYHVTSFQIDTSNGNRSLYESTTFMMHKLRAMEINIQTNGKLAFDTYEV